MRWLFLLLLCAALPAQTPARMARVVVRVVEVQVNQPVLGARVELQGTGTSSRPPERRVSLCEPGTCDYPVIPGYTYKLSVSHPSYLIEENPFIGQAEFTFTAGRGESIEFEVRMIRPAYMDGKVFDEKGKPVAGALLGLRSSFQIEGDFRPFRLNSRSSANGSFGFPRIPPGKFGMWIRPPASLLQDGYVKNEDTGDTTGYPVQVYHTGIEEESYAEPVVTWPGAQLARRAVVLRRMRVFHLTGRLVDHLTRQPLRLAQVALRTRTEPPQEIYTPFLVDDEDAGFEFDDLAAGEYEILVYRPAAGNSLPWVAPVRIDKASGAPDLTLTVPGWSSLTVDLRIQREVPTSAGLRIGLRAEGNPEDIAWAPYLRRGAFGFPDLPPGRYVPVVVPPPGGWVAGVRFGDADAYEAGVQLIEGANAPLEITIRSSPAALRGEVFDSRDRRLTRGRVLALPEDAAMRRRPNALASSRILPNGSFEIRGLAPGVYRVVALEAPPRDEDPDKLLNRYAVDWLKVDAVPGVSTRLTLRSVAP